MSEVEFPWVGGWRTGHLAQDGVPYKATPGHRDKRTGGSQVNGERLSPGYGESLVTGYHETWRQEEQIGEKKNKQNEGGGFGGCFSRRQGREGSFVGISITGIR